MRRRHAISPGFSGHYQDLLVEITSLKGMILPAILCLAWVLGEFGFRIVKRVFAPRSLSYILGFQLLAACETKLLESHVSVVNVYAVMRGGKQGDALTTPSSNVQMPSPREFLWIPFFRSPFSSSSSSSLVHPV